MLFFRPTALTVSKLVVINHITFRSCRVIRKLNIPPFFGRAEQLYNNSAAQKQTTI